MNEEKSMPEKPEQESPPVQEDTSYEDAMQARVDRLAQKAHNTHRRNLLISIGAFFVLVFVTVASLFIMRACQGGRRFQNSWLGEAHRRRSGR